MMEAVAKIEKLYMENGYVMGEAVLLDNPKANQLKTLIDNGIKMSVSSRGLGSVKNGLVEEYKLITFDIIPNLGQSDYNAEMYGIVEGVLKDKEFLITESGDIVEVIKEEKIEIKEDIKEEIDQEKVSEEILNKFKKIFKSVKIEEHVSQDAEEFMVKFDEQVKLLKDAIKESNDNIYWKKIALNLAKFVNNHLS